MDSIQIKTILSRFGILKFIIFSFTFTVSRIPLWFLLLSMIFLNNGISFEYNIALIFSIILFRSFVESEITGGGLSFYFTMRVLRFLSAIIFFTVSLFLYIYLVSSNYDSVDVKFSLILAVFVIWFFILRDKSNGYWKGYYMPFSYRLLVNIMWLYILLIPDIVQIKMVVLLTIYSVEFYNLYFNNPLRNLPTKKI